MYDIISLMLKKIKDIHYIDFIEVEDRFIFYYKEDEGKGLGTNLIEMSVKKGNGLEYMIHFKGEGA